MWTLSTTGSVVHQHSTFKVLQHVGVGATGSNGAAAGTRWCLDFGSSASADGGAGRQTQAPVTSALHKSFSVLSNVCAQITCTGHIFFGWTMSLRHKSRWRRRRRWERRWRRSRWQRRRWRLETQALPTTESHLHFAIPCSLVPFLVSSWGRLLCPYLSQCLSICLARLCSLHWVTSDHLSLVAYEKSLSFAFQGCDHSLEPHRFHNNLQPGVFRFCDIFLPRDSECYFKRQTIWWVISLLEWWKSLEGS